MVKGFFTDKDKTVHPINEKTKRVVGNSEESHHKSGDDLESFAEEQRADWEEENHHWFWNKENEEKFFNISETGVSMDDQTRYLTWDEVEDLYNDIQGRDSAEDASDFINKIKIEPRANISNFKELCDGVYPEVLTLDGFDHCPWVTAQQFGLDDDRPINEIEKSAINYAKLIGGVVYTQIDGDEDRVYVLGPTKVNRTGLYEVVKF